MKTSMFKTRANSIRAIVFMTALLPSLTVAALSYSVGIKGGINFFAFDGKDAQIAGASSSHRMDDYASLFACLQLHPSTSIQAEIAYVKKGQNYNLLYDAIAYEDSFYTTHNRWNEFYRFDYIQIPLLLKVCPVAVHLCRLQIYAGPAINFLFSAKEIVYDNDILTSMDITSSTNSIDCSGIVGVTVEIPIGRSYALIDFRYDYGFISTARVTNRDLEVNPSAHPLDRRNNGITLMVGYAYKFKR